MYTEEYFKSACLQFDYKYKLVDKSGKVWGELPQSIDFHAIDMINRRLQGKSTMLGGLFRLEDPANHVPTLVFIEHPSRSHRLTRLIGVYIKLRGFNRMTKCEGISELDALETLSILASFLLKKLND